MDGLEQVQLFFIISSVGFVALWLFLAVLLYYVLRVIRTFDRILTKIESDINKVGDITREMFEELKGSGVWNFIFRKKKKNRKEKTDSD